MGPASRNSVYIPDQFPRGDLDEAIREITRLWVDLCSMLNKGMSLPFCNVENTTSRMENRIDDSPALRGTCSALCPEVQTCFRQISARHDSLFSIAVVR